MSRIVSLSSFGRSFSIVAESLCIFASGFGAAKAAKADAAIAAVARIFIICAFIFSISL